MEKIKALFCKINRNLLIYLIILIVILVIAHLILKVFCLKFREWVYLTVIAISIISISISLIQKFIKASKEIKFIIGYICAILAILSVMFWKIVAAMLFLLLLIINPKSEHIVERQGDKYVAIVESGFLDTTVYFYKYVNSFVMGSEAEFEEYYKGSYDPIKREKEENTIRTSEGIIIAKPAESEIANQEDVEIVNPSETEIVNPEDILYEKEIRKDTAIRIVNRGNILGGRMIVNVQKTTDGGETWNNQLKDSDGCITVNNEAKFIFVNENVGFINNLSLYIIGEENNSLLVTVNGGESFKSANFIFPSDIKDTVFYISDLPYLESDKLRVELFSPANKASDEVNYYKFESVDNGLNWTYSK